MPFVYLIVFTEDSLEIFTQSQVVVSVAGKSENVQF